MREFIVTSAALPEEEGFFDRHGVARSFFYFRYFDVVSDQFLDRVGVGPIARAEQDLSTYIATADMTIHQPVVRATSLRFAFDVVRIGGKSFGYQSRMLDAESGGLHATYDAVSVTMDMRGDPAPVAVPEATRAALQQYYREGA